MNEMTLYEISDEIRQILSLTDEEGELSDELETRLDALQLAFPEKAANIVKFRQGLLATAWGLEREIERLKAWKERIEHREGWLKNYLKFQMEKVGLDHLETPTAKLNIRQNPPAAHLEPGASIPPEFSKVSVEFSKSAALAAWKAGATLPDTVTVTRGTSLRIS